MRFTQFEKIMRDFPCYVDVTYFKYSSDWYSWLHDYVGEKNESYIVTEHAIQMDELNRRGSNVFLYHFKTNEHAIAFKLRWGGDAVT